MAEAFAGLPFALMEIPVFVWESADSAGNNNTSKKIKILVFMFYLDFWLVCSVDYQANKHIRLYDIVWKKKKNKSYLSTYLSKTL